MLEITNRDLEKATGFTHKQIKRWAVAFLPPDPNSGQHSGKARRYTLDQAAKLALGGHLVKRLRYNISEAQKCLGDIFGYLGEKKWLPSVYFKFRKDTIRSGWTYEYKEEEYPHLFLELHRGKGGGHRYRIKQILGRTETDAPDDSQERVYHEKYRYYDFGDDTIFAFEQTNTLILKQFIESLAEGLPTNR
jgi:hypothetical protein